MAAFSTAAAVVGSAALGAVGASAQAKAAKKAGQAVADSTDAATNLQREIYYDQRDLMAPSIQAGASARARQMLMQGYSPAEVRAYLQSTSAALRGTEQSGPSGPQAGPGVGNGILGPAVNLLNGAGEPIEFGGGNGETIDLTPEDYSWVDRWSYEAQSPSYQFRFDEGQRALERSKAAGGDYFSGDTAMALDEYGQNMASTEFEADWRRLGQLAGDGQASTDTVVSAAGNFGQQAGANTIAGGRARASGYESAGNAWGGFWAGAAGIPMYGAGQGWWK